MTTQEQIAKIQKERYGDYKGRLLERLGVYHQEIRESLGDERFLKFLEGVKVANPLPLFKIGIDPYDTFTNPDSSGAWIAIKKKTSESGLVTVTMRPYKQFKRSWMQSIYKWWTIFKFKIGL